MLFDDNRVFISARNSEVGKSIDKVLKSSYYYDYWEGNEHYYGHKDLVIIDVDDYRSEYHFESVGCSWALEVEKSSRLVTGWRFIGDGSECKYKRFYEGPF